MACADRRLQLAVRWLRANAAKFNVNPDRIGVFGMSAGGHLVAYLGVSAADVQLEGRGGYPGVSSRVQAVVDWSGPADFTEQRINTDFLRSLYTQLCGGGVFGEAGRLAAGQSAAARRPPLSTVLDRPRRPGPDRTHCTFGAAGTGASPNRQHRGASPRQRR